MTDRISDPAAQAAALVAGAYASAAAQGALPGGISLSPRAEAARDASRGDWASPFALAAAGAMGMRPREIAGILLEHLDLSGSVFASAEVAGGGFLNFRLGDGWYAAVLARAESGDLLGDRRSALAGRQVLVETAAGGAPPLADLRARLTGGALAGLMEAQGAAVCRSAGDGGPFHRTVLVLVPGSPPPQTPPGAEVLAVGPVRLSGGGPALEAAVSMDALRWVLTAGPNRPAELDTDLMIREDWANPLYRTEYACRRCRALTAALAAEGTPVPPAKDVDTALLGDTERALLRRLAQLPDQVDLAVRDLDPGRISRWLTALGEDFYRFYAACPLRCGDAAVTAVRLKLLDAAGAGLETGLRLLGIGT